MELTGNPSEKDMSSAAMARSCGANVYEAMCKDRAAEMAKGKTTERKAMQVHCPRVSCWLVLVLVSARKADMARPRQRTQRKMQSDTKEKEHQRLDPRSQSAPEPGVVRI